MSQSAMLARQAAAPMVPDLEGPAGPPPPGVIPQLDDPPNGNHIAVPITAVCTVLVFILYMIRFYAKWHTKMFNVADYLSAIAFPLFWVYVYYSFRLSWSPAYMVHMYDMKLGSVTEFSYVCWIATLFYFVLIALIKVAILLEWTTIFATKSSKNIFAWACYATAVVIACLSIILFSMNMANCTPFERNWNPLLPNSFCRFEVPTFGLASAVTNLVFDVVPILLAQSAIWNLRLSWQKKVGVSVVFLIGVIGIAVGIVRLIYSIKFVSSNDTTFFFSIMGLCSMVETTCAILVLCAPFAPKAFSSVKQTKTVSQLSRYMTFRTNTAYGSKDSKSTTSFQELTDIPSRSGPNPDPWGSPNVGSMPSYPYDAYGRRVDQAV
ncbi:hypothetical protein ACRE_051670 [Hapsidospora chrysogenum ATCC 11550]|uniref:Rhodopsin domain-containing protein n=1 Tax=Hapsidospora chrysogenum (strain ATCC 11550 / CBS 779.69 / DSM 880 / IAM 14645 / JCM 23072 / IMI 49137) TaxID=857340 RepID=A0A086T418_HAPC1|nr:hypothetical protein ACRE_051670 [Hapsidospora chrysogenum ATCC 11550]